MKHLKSARAALLTLAIACVCIRVAWWALEPFIPYIITGLILLTVIGVAVFRSTRL